MSLDLALSPAAADATTTALARTDPDARPVVSVVIVSYNTRQMTLDCLRALRADLGDLPAEVFVVDNASTDDSPAAVAAEDPAVRVIANPANVGFGAANNQAMRLARGQFILLLNSDAFPRPGATAALVDYLAAHPGVGVVGPKLLNADGSTQQSCYRFPTPGQCWRENLWLGGLLRRHPRLGDYRYWAHDAERDVDWIVGACMLLRREVFERAGGFDEAFFMYAEETDWQRRIRDAGWRIAFTPAVQVTHLGGASGARDKAKVNRHFFDSLDRYERKHHGRLGLIALRAAMVLGCSVRGLGWGAVSLLAPRRERRQHARAKARMHGWLFVRQLTHWRRQGGR
ncbi:MAG TPA: glycosyltransferase family 2 protein [Tepidisphaeraceae bacterium]|nr:glycosyltransferase family 2 protein [Tepidisphaeraceae bacterium]